MKELSPLEESIPSSMTNESDLRSTWHLGFRKLMYIMVRVILLDFRCVKLLMLVVVVCGSNNNSCEHDLIQLEVK